MAFNLSSLHRKHSPLPPRILMYGGDGVGKTTFGMKAPNPVFIQIEKSRLVYKLKENGKEVDVHVPAFPIVTEYSQIEEIIGSLLTDEHDFQSVVLDSVDWMERLIHEHTARQNGWASIESVDYGKGYDAALYYWRIIIDGFNMLREQRNMAVIWLGHAEVKKFTSPDVEPYDRYRPKLREKANDIVRENMDHVFFVNYRTSVVKTDLGFKKSSVRGVGNDDRFIHTTQKPAHVAKNRFDVDGPDTIAMDLETSGWAEISKYIDYYNKAANVVSETKEMSNG